MGGLGSGNRFPLNGRDRTWQYRCLDIGPLHKGRDLEPGRRFRWSWWRDGKKTAEIGITTASDGIKLDYHADGQPVSYRIPVVRTPCNYGGSRPWFLCPGQGCGRRVAKLYGGRTFLCRRCRELAYESQRESSDDRALSKAQAIRKQLGGAGDMFRPFPPRPKGMHFKTYWRLRDEHDRLWRQSLMGIAIRFRMDLG